MTASTPVSIIVAAAGGHDYLTDALAHQAPSSAPQPALGAVYVDPVFGGHIRRVTGTGRGGNSDNYASNSWWNADGTRFIAKPSGSAPALINASTGAILIASLPFGTATYNMQFDPVDPNTYYFWSGASLMSYNISTQATTTVHTFSSALGSLGGSLDYIDNSGRYFLVNIGGTTTVYDRIANVVFSGGSTFAIGGGWAGITPSGNHLVMTDGQFQFFSYAIDKVNHAVATAGVLFWTLCGDHGDVMTGSDGKDYLISRNCWDQSEIWRIDVTLPQTTVPNGGLAQQKSQNKRLMQNTWSDSFHFSCVPTSDWAFLDTEDGGANTEIYWNEIVGINVMTGEIRRYAHHLSAVGLGYYDQPRISASRDGKKVLFASSWGGSNYGFASPGLDLYTLEIA